MKSLPESPTATREWQPLVMIFTVLLGLTFALYVPSFSNDWVMDDYPVIADNPDIRSLANFFEDSYPGRPLREITYLLDYTLFGLEPAGYHIQQNFWHWLNACLVLLLSLMVGFRRVVACCAALLFLVHPLQVEVVANISHRKDSLALAFSLLAMLAWLHGRKTGCWRWSYLVAAGGLFGIGLLAKENVMVLPAVILAREIAMLPLPLRDRVARIAGIAAFAAIAGRVAWLVGDANFQSDIGKALLKLGAFQNWMPEGYYLAVFKGWAFMWGKLLWPVDMSMEYAFAIPDGWMDPWVLTGIVVFLVALLGIYWTGRRFSPAYLPLTWFVLFWIPTSNLLGNYSYFAADRYLYAPMAGLSILAAYILWTVARRREAWFFCLSLPLVVALVWPTWRQQEIWRDGESFSRQIVMVNPNSLEGLIGASEAAERRGDLDTAHDFIERARRINPSDARVYRMLGRIAMQRGLSTEASEHYRRALAIDPEHVHTLLDMGVLHDILGQHDKAIDCLQKVIKLNPHNEAAYTGLGIVYEHQRRYAEAKVMHRKALSERPDYGNAYYNLGVVFYLEGKKQEAVEAFKKASLLLPSDEDAHYNLAIVSLESDDDFLAQSAITRLSPLNPVRAKQLETQLTLKRTKQTDWPVR